MKDYVPDLDDISFRYLVSDFPKYVCTYLGVPRRCDLPLYKRACQTNVPYGVLQFSILHAQILSQIPVCCILIHVFFCQAASHDIHSFIGQATYQQLTRETDAIAALVRDIAVLRNRLQELRHEVLPHESRSMQMVSRMGRSTLTHDYNILRNLFVRYTYLGTVLWSLYIDMYFYVYFGLVTDEAWQNRNGGNDYNCSRRGWSIYGVSLVPPTPDSYLAQVPRYMPGTVGYIGSYIASEPAALFFPTNCRYAQRTYLHTY